MVEDFTTNADAACWYGGSWNAGDGGIYIGNYVLECGRRNLKLPASANAGCTLRVTLTVSSDTHNLTFGFKLNNNIIGSKTYSIPGPHPYNTGFITWSDDFIMPSNVGAGSIVQFFIGVSDLNLYLSAVTIVVV